MTLRAESEIRHGRILSVHDTESLWGWGTPAGKMRATRRAKLIATGAQLERRKRVLEIGCGTGMFTEIFSRTGAQIVAVDISGDLLEKAKARCLPSGNVHFHKKRFEDCDVDGSFDAVIGSSVLHHLDFKQALSKMYDLLKPGGIVSFAEPNILNPQVFIERRFRKFFPYVSPEETAFVRWRLRDAFLTAGFERVETIPFDYLHPATPVVMISLVKALGVCLEKTPLLREFAGSLYVCASRPLK